MREINTMKIKFHQRFLNIFELDELNLMKSHADFSANKNGFIDVMLVRTDKVFVEIYTYRWKVKRVRICFNRCLR